MVDCFTRFFVLSRVNRLIREKSDLATNKRVWPAEPALPGTHLFSQVSFPFVAVRIFTGS